MNKNQFIAKLLLFVFAALPFITFKSLNSYFTKSYEMEVNGSEIYISLHKSNIRKKVKVLIIGDSVGKQLYDNDIFNDDIYSLACNQTISMAGYYILLQNFINQNTGQLPDEVLLIITPETFKNNLDQRFSFHYFLKPFDNSLYNKYFTRTCNLQINKIPSYFLSQYPFIVNTNWSPNYVEKPDTTFKVLSPITTDYIKRIDNLCVVNHLKFTLYAPPVKQSLKKEIIDFSHSQKEFQACGLSSQLNNYFKQIRFLPDSLFQDRIHFKKKFIPNDYFNLLL